MRAPGTAGLGASSQSLVDDGLEGTGAATAFSAATEAAIDLLCAARKIFRGADGTTDIVVTEDVAGTNNHKKAGPYAMLSPSILKSAARCKRKNRLFK
jgi:hypothetical protein